MATGGARRHRAEPTATFVLGTLTAIVLGETIRAIFPILYNLREESGAGRALLGAIGVFVVGPLVVTALLRRVVAVGTAVLVAALALAAARGTLQIVEPIPLWLGGSAVVAGLVALALLIDLERARGQGARLAIALLVGLSVDSAIRGAFLTWDPVWQDGLAPGLIASTLVLGLIVAAWFADRSSPAGLDPGDGPTWSVALLGPFLLLQLQFLQNAAFAASDADVGLEAGVALILVGDVLAVLAALLVAKHPLLAWRVGAGLIVVVGTAMLAIADGTGIAFALPVTSAAAGVLLVLALAARRAGERTLPSWRSDAAVALGMGVFVGVAFGYQIDIDVPLPVPRPAWPIAAAVLLSLAATRTMRPVPLPRWVAAIPAVCLTVPLVLTIPTSRERGPAGTPPGDIRVVDWNIHTAVNGDGQVDMTEVERVIASQDPDVIVLQEVGRGWPIAGQVDQAEWLSRRLDMPYAWASAADDQFGNVVFSRIPILGVDVLPLPYGEGPQHRSALRVRPIDDIAVIGAHLQNGDKPRTREAQIEAILETWVPVSEGLAAPPVVLAGDLNMQPTEDNVALFLDAGLTSVQDEVGDPTASTARDPKFPGDRVNWIWVAGVRPEDFAILESHLSYHLPLAVTVSI